MDCSKTENYFAEKARMTKYKKTVGCDIKCCDCALSHHNNKYKEYCEDLEITHSDEAISIVQEWSDEHPRKTRLQDFLEKFPKAALDISGYPRRVCARRIYGEEPNCAKPCTDCWNKPVEEVE